MKKTLILAFLFGSMSVFASNEQWDSKLLLETCPKELKNATEFVKKYVKNDKLIAIIPKTIGYQYFNVTFKVLENGMATKDAFTFEFEYWTEDDQHEKCTRVEAMDVLL